MACIEHDVEVQRRGCVDIFYLIGGCVSNLAHAEPSKTDIPRKFHQSLPRRVVAMHAVYSDPMMGPFMILLPYLVSKFKLARFRSHYGKLRPLCACVHGAYSWIFNRFVGVFDPARHHTGSHMEVTYVSIYWLKTMCL